MLISEAMGLWQSLRDVAPETVRCTAAVVKMLGQSGLVNVEDLTPEALAAWMVEKRRCCSIPSVNTYLSRLAALLRVLVKIGRLSKETAAAVASLSFPSRRQAQLSASFLSVPQFRALVAAARERSPRAAAMVSVCVYTGLRASELRRLRWADVDLEARLIRVRILLDLGQAGRIKTRRERVVSITDDLLSTLRELPRAGPFLFPKHYRREGHDFVGAWSARADLQWAAARAGLADVDWHLLRHTRASWLVQAGVPVAKVAKEMGHSMVTCLTFYAGLAAAYDPELERANVERPEA